MAIKSRSTPKISKTKGAETYAQRGRRGQAGTAGGRVNSLKVS